MKTIVYLVIRADTEVRVAKRPKIAADEIAYRVAIDFPESWGKVVGDIALTAPEFVGAVDVTDFEGPDAA